MVRAGSRNDVALSGDLASEAGNWAGDLVDLTKDNYTWEATLLILLLLLFVSGQQTV